VKRHLSPARFSLTLLTTAGLVCPGWSQPAPASQQLAAEEIARAAAADFLATTDVVDHERLAIIPRGGDMSESVAESLAERLREGGRAIAETQRARAAAREAGVGWAAAEPVGAREIAIMAGESGSQAVILVTAETTAHLDDGTVTVIAQLVLADPAELGWPWNFEVEQEARAAQSRSYWQEHPVLVIGVVAALVVLWMISALRRRAGT
jgi:hypothetical protein